LETVRGPRTLIEADKEIIYEGQAGHSAYILCSGWACSYKRLADGTRHIIEIQMPGDILGLRSVMLPSANLTFEALTEIEVMKIRTDRLLDAFKAAPRLAGAILWVASRDDAMMVEHLVSICGRDAMQRTVHLLLELWTRARLVGLGNADGFECPLSQSVVADALGMTAIHLNRVLRQLREAGLLVFRDGHVHFQDQERLSEIAGFDFGYLQR
jgi:CRP-like cAMP-binding protein